jgi:hypothetical protein
MPSFAERRVMIGRKVAAQCWDIPDVAKSIELLIVATGMKH